MLNREVDDVLEKMKRRPVTSVGEEPQKKRLNSRKKGCTFERQLCKILSERFGRPFARSPGSGAFGTVSNVDARALEVLTADIICPEGFEWSVEAKHGYDVDFWSIFSSGSGVHRGRKGDTDNLEEFWAQAIWQAERARKRPVLVYRKDGRPACCVVKDENDFGAKLAAVVQTALVLWQGRLIVSLKDWLSMPDEEFFGSGFL